MLLFKENNLDVITFVFSFMPLKREERELSLETSVTTLFSTHNGFPNDTFQCATFSMLPRLPLVVSSLAKINKLKAS